MLKMWVNSHLWGQNSSFLKFSLLKIFSKHFHQIFVKFYHITGGLTGGLKWLFGFLRKILFMLKWSKSVHHIFLKVYLLTSVKVTLGSCKENSYFAKNGLSGLKFPLNSFFQLFSEIYLNEDQKVGKRKIHTLLKVKCFIFPDSICVRINCSFLYCTCYFALYSIANVFHQDIVILRLILILH